METNKTMLIQENIEKHLARELDLFEASSHRTMNVKLLYGARKTVLPILIESERAFSAAGLFVTKLRSRLNDCSLDDLCFLRLFYTNQYIQPSS